MTDKTSKKKIRKSKKKIRKSKKYKIIKAQCKTKVKKYNRKIRKNKTNRKLTSKNKHRIMNVVGGGKEECTGHCIDVKGIEDINSTCCNNDDCDREYYNHSECRIKEEKQ